jgi:hypothetical protein
MIGACARFCLSWNLNLFHDAVVGDTIDKWPWRRIDDSGDTLVDADEITQLFPGYRIRSP